MAIQGLMHWALTAALTAALRMTNLQMGTFAQPMSTYHATQTQCMFGIGIKGKAFLK